MQSFMVDIAPALRGFGLGFGLIAAIGAQNAYVLTRGILRNHHWLIALVCSFLDALLITVGILGMGAFIENAPGMLKGLTFFGAAFLLCYGFLAFKRALSAKRLNAEGNRVSAIAAVVTAVSLSIFNPHVYLDTVVLIGSISTQEAPQDRVTFGAGAVIASFVWFFCLALGGQWMQRWFQSAKAWRLLDIFVGVVMWFLAFTLLKTVI